MNASLFGSSPGEADHWETANDTVTITIVELIATVLSPSGCKICYWLLALYVDRAVLTGTGAGRSRRTRTGTEGSRR